MMELGRYPVLGQCSTDFAKGPKGSGSKLDTQSELRYSSCGEIAEIRPHRSLGISHDTYHLS